MRYGIISDIHGNLEALKAVLEKIKELDEIICLGDIVGYGPNPNECIDIIRKLNIKTIAGNHDKAATGEMELTWFNKNARDAIIWTRNVILPENLNYLKNLPLKINFGTFEIVHGSLRYPLEEYITSIEEAIPTFELMKTPLCFIGHSHIPLCIVKEKNGRYDGWLLSEGNKLKIEDFEKTILNAGSIGQPRDNNPKASYLIYDDKENSVTNYRIDYNIETVQEKMRLANLPQPLIERLKYGV